MFKLRKLSKKRSDSCLFLKWRHHSIVHLAWNGDPHMTQPHCWKDENAQLFVQSLAPGVTNKSSCRDYTGKVIKSTDYVQRWDKRERVAQQCFIAN